jgi:hypothetical protein
LRDPDEHLRLANWCHSHHLREQAILEAKEAVELRPENAESRRLLRNLERVAGSHNNLTAAKAAPDSELPPAAPPVSSDSLGLFVTKVQPFLMNACANCHSAGRGTSFKLTRVFDSNLNNRLSTQLNLAAVLQQVNKEKPQLSPLLAKAVSVHGDMVQPPVKGRESAAFRSLEEWVRVTLQDAPQLQEAAVVSVVPPLETAPAKSPMADGFAASQNSPGVATGSPAQVAPTKPLAARSASEPADAYDPIIFNRQMHPDRSGEGDKR